jgi:molybdate transport system substrate-binding protein
MPRDLRALTSMAPREVVLEAAALFQRQHAIRIEVQSAGGVDVARRVAAGEAVDIVVLASDAIDKLAASGDLLSAGRVDLMKSAIAIGVRAGTPHPAAADEQALKALVLGAHSLSYSTGPSGQYLERLFARWGIYDQVRERIIIPAPGVPVAQLIAAGKVQLGFQQLSELISAPGVEVAALLPGTVQHLTTFRAAISASCENPDQARLFAQFAASGALDETRKRQGMLQP